MKNHYSYRDASKANYGQHHDDSTGQWSANIEQLNCGSLMRIADAVEKMASSYDDMRNSRDHYMRRTEELQAANDTLHRRISALRGAITRMRAIMEKK